ACHELARRARTRSVRLRTYLEELGYVLRAPRTIRSKLRLLAAAVGFHLNNLVKLRQPSTLATDIGLSIGGINRIVAIRPCSGDLFILFEVLAFDSYRIPESSIDPLSVHTIVDCGANIGLTALYLASAYPNARILCVEPDPANFALLQRNTRNEP